MNSAASPMMPSTTAADTAATCHAVGSAAARTGADVDVRRRRRGRAQSGPNR